MPPPAPRRHAPWPARSSGPRSTASPPTATSWCASCAIPSSSPATSTPASSCATTPPCSAPRWPTHRRRQLPRRGRRAGRPGRAARPGAGAAGHALGLAQQPLGPADDAVHRARRPTSRSHYRFDRAGTCTLRRRRRRPRPRTISVLSCTPEIGGPRRVGRAWPGATTWHRVGLTTFVDGPDGSSALTEIERFPLPGSQLAAGALVAPLPGTVVKVAVAAGDPVRAGRHPGRHRGHEDGARGARPDRRDRDRGPRGRGRAGRGGAPARGHRRPRPGRRPATADARRGTGHRACCASPTARASSGTGWPRRASCSRADPIDVLTGDYLAELTMLILWKSRQRDPSLGYARTFYRQMEEVLGTCVDRGVKVVANAGGLNPAGLAQRLRELAGKLGIDANVAHVEGDDILGAWRSLQADGDPLAHLDTGRPLAEAGQRSRERQRLSGRVRDRRGPGRRRRRGGDGTRHRRLARGRARRRGTSDGQRTDWDRLAGAVVVGHVIECGTQTTGGNYAFFGEVPGLEHPGFPIAEVAEDGSAVITKHPGTGGPRVGRHRHRPAPLRDRRPALRQPRRGGGLLDHPRSRSVGPDRVRVSGVRGRPAPEKLKVSINLLGGWRNTMTFVLTGLDIEEKAALVRRTMDELVGGRGALRRLRRPPHPHRRARRPDQRAGQRPAPRHGQGPRPRGGGPALLQRRHRARPGELPRLLPDVAPRRRHGLRRVLADARAPPRRRRDRRPPRRPARGHRPGGRRPVPPRHPRHGSTPGPGALDMPAPPTGDEATRAARDRHRGPLGRQGGQRQRRACGPAARPASPGCRPSSPWTGSGSCSPKPPRSRSTATSCPTSWPSTSWCTASWARAWPRRRGPTPRPRAWASTCARAWSRCPWRSSPTFPPPDPR